MENSAKRCNAMSAETLAAQGIMADRPIVATHLRALDRHRKAVWYGEKTGGDSVESTQQAESVSCPRSLASRVLRWRRDGFRSRKKQI